jgi:hypothetical protein
MLSRAARVLRHFGRYTRIDQKDLKRMSKKGISAADLVNFTTEKYNPKAAIKDAVEHLYFTDVDKAELKQFVKGLGKEGLGPQEAGGMISINKGYQLTEEEDKKLAEMYSRPRIGTLANDELHKMIRQTFYTKKLLRVFLSNLKSVTKGSLLLLFDTLERNLNNPEEAEREAKANWERRREALRRMNPKLDIKYRAEHYSREQVLADECYQRIKGFILKRITGSEATINNAADLCCKVLDFEKKLDDQFMEAIIKALDKVDTSTMDPDYLGSVLSKSLLLLNRLRKHKLVSNAVAFE